MLMNQQLKPDNHWQNISGFTTKTGNIDLEDKTGPGLL